MTSDDDRDEYAADPELASPKRSQRLLELKSLRASTKGSITRIRNLVAKKGSALTSEEVECRLGILESYFKQILSVQASIEKICPEADKPANAVFIGEVEEVYVSAKSSMMALMPTRRSSVADISMANNTSHVAPTSRLRREIKLPKFEGKYADFPKFIALFNKLVHKDESLDNCERFLILKDSLGSKPLAAISDFDETDDNYPKALERLKNCFNKKALMFDEHIAALFELEKANKGSATHLRKIINTTNARLSAMLSLGSYEDIANALVIFLVMERLDSESQAKWEEAVDFGKLSSWEECSDVLSRRCQILEARETKSERVDLKQGVVKGVQQESKSKPTFWKRNQASSLAIEHLACSICKKSGHDVLNCSMFVSLSPKERYSAARSSKLCILCLKKGHWFKNCRAVKCVSCNKPHHVLLHRNENAVLNSNEQTAVNDDDSIPTKVVLHSSSDNSSVLDVFLETVVLLVRDVCGDYHQVRAILDSASQINVMCDYMAQVLRLPREMCAMNVNGISGNSTNITKKVQATIKSRLSEYQINLEFYLLSKITGKKPEKFVDVSRWKIPKNIEMADPCFNMPARVDMLLGAEVFLELLCIGQIKLKDELPRLQKTVLGWVVSGATKGSKSNHLSVDSLAVNVNLVDNKDEQLNSLVERFWDMEQIPNQSTFLTEEEAECEKIFLANVRRDDNGQFLVKIPFKSEVNKLGNSFNTAERRFLAQERRLSKDSALKKKYDDFIEEYIRLGHMERVEAEEMSKLKYFSPHQHVLRPESTSTKLRVVFDCSCKTSNGLSLNDVMMKGPTVQDDLLSIILRFRTYKFAITADVTKMYRQVRVFEEDANYQAILWRRSSEAELAAYRLLTVTYGTTAAPYLATRCLKKLGEDNLEKFPLGSKKRVPEADKEKTLRVNDADIIKTLGIVWEPTSDIFSYVWPEISSTKIVTKRVVLAEMSALFDPLGLVNPIVVKAKIFMQDLWITKVAWDESLPNYLHSFWMEFRNKLKGIRDIKVPRYILSEKRWVRVDMHGFADASERAYGCCVYIRCVDEDQGITVNLWSAKSRVAPLKTKSLPRLELMAAHLLSTLVEKTQKNVPVHIDNLYMWSDSEIVLEWLNAHPSNWNTFVANRVSLIQEATKSAIWRHVPSRLNPADVISRGAYAEDLMDSFWFLGPPFLMKPNDEWPVNKVRSKAAEVDEERRRCASTIIAESKQNYFVEWLEKRSEFQHTQKRVAFLLCLARRIKGVNGQLPILSATLLDEALVRITFCLQQHFFETEYRVLKQTGEVQASSKIKGLSLFIESYYGVDLLRVGGRLKNSNLPYDEKHPILLPGDSCFVRSYVRYVHEKNMHVGTQALMAILRQRFWIVHARKMVRSVTTKCLRCFRCRPRLENQIMGNLPTDRVIVAKPFTTTGVDFCGPVMTTLRQRGMKATKSYIAVFICFATKAVHMEVVSDLSTKAFLAALKRFVARRGLCAKLFCDNGTNFVGARRELEKLKESFYDQQTQGQISEFCTANNMNFCHIPPRSPHFGGLWEAAVKSAKYHLTRILGESYLTFEELSTVVAEIEAILNSRPLTAMSNDPNDEAAITPAHFLTGGPLISISEPTVEQENISLLNRWLRISAIQQHFWRRWSSEYLHELQRKSKWTNKKSNLSEGDLVLVSEENLPPKNWLLGRVVKTIADKSNYIWTVLHLHSIHLAAEETTTEVSATTPLPNGTLAELLPNSAEKLVRYRRQPPGKIKHYIRSSKRSKPRRRLKRPKITHSPPSYSYVEPIPYHKPRLPSPPEHPTFSFDEFKHLNFDVSEFDFPPYSYEAQAMDLDFYSPDHSSYDTPKKPSNEYTIESEPETPPSYKYKIESTAEVSVPREPHQTYGVPKEYKYPSDLKHPSVGSNNYITDQHSLLEQHPAYESASDDSAKYNSGWSSLSVNNHQPAITYGAPSDHGSSYHSETSYKQPAPHIPKYVAHSPTIEQSYGPPPSNHPKTQSHGNHNMYDKKLTNTAFRPSQHHFAEPPSTKTDIEITYSPSYEINIPPTSQIHPQDKYIEHSGNFAEPPAYSPEHISVPEYPQKHPQAHVPPPPSYQTPEHTAISPTISHGDFTPPHQELPLNPHHRQPAYDFPKSSYEVPIYDPIPFDSSNKNEQEYYPPHVNMNNNHHHGTVEYKKQNNFINQEKYDHHIPRNHAFENVLDADTHSSSTSITTTTTKKPQKTNRNHKYGRGNSTITPIKHILDVPELEEAFEAGKRKQLLDQTQTQNLESDTETNESSNVEKTHYYVSSTMTTPLATENYYINQAWNPMRISTSSRIIPPKESAKTNPTPKFLPTIAPTVRQKTQIRFKNNGQGSSSSSLLPDLLQTTKISNSLGNIAILSIDKSRSHSYYDGTVSPPTSQSLTSTPNMRPTRFRMPTKLAAQSRTDGPSKHTTKSVFETTYFKFPRNEREVQKPQQLFLEVNLPKNHKLY